MQLEKWEVGPDQISIELLEALGEIAKTIGPLIL